MDAALEAFGESTWQRKFVTLAEQASQVESARLIPTTLHASLQLPLMIFCQRSGIGLCGEAFETDIYIYWHRWGPATGVTWRQSGESPPTHCAAGCCVSTLWWLCCATSSPARHARPLSAWPCFQAGRDTLDVCHLISLRGVGREGRLLLNCCRRRGIAAPTSAVQSLRWTSPRYSRSWS